MAHTNETTNYHLSQFIGTDIPNPLTDYNGDMEKIDTAIKAVADSAVSESARVTALETQNGDAVLTTTAQTLSGAVNELDSDLGGVDARLVTAEGKIVSDEATLGTAVDNISTLAGKVSGLETKVGSAVLTTTASDCSGAINELNAGKADKVTAVATVTTDGIKNEGAIITELVNGITLTKDAYITQVTNIDTIIYNIADIQHKSFNGVSNASGGIAITVLSPTNCYYSKIATDGTVTCSDVTSTVLTAGRVFTLYN